MIKGGDGNDVEYGGDRERRRCGSVAAPTPSTAAPGDDVLHALADDNQLDIVDCGAGHDVAWLNVAREGQVRDPRLRGSELDRSRPPDQLAEETGD